MRQETRLFSLTNNNKKHLSWRAKMTNLISEQKEAKKDMK